MITTKHFVNGKLNDQIDISDRGLAYGDGIFETLSAFLIIDCSEDDAANPTISLPFESYHFQRFREGCKRLNYLTNAPKNDTPLSEHEDEIEQFWLRFKSSVTQAFENLEDFEGACEYKDLESLKLKNKIIVPFTVKLTLTRGSGPRGYKYELGRKNTWVVSIFPSTKTLDDYLELNDDIGSTGFKLKSCKTIVGLNPSLAGLKHLNRLESVIARSEWNDEFDDGLLFDIEGNLIESTMANVFLIDESDNIITPKLDKCGVKGVMRSWVFDALSSKGITINEVNIKRHELHRFTMGFLTNSLIGIKPIDSIDGVSLAKSNMVKDLQLKLNSFISDAIRLNTKN